VEPLIAKTVLPLLEVLIKIRLPVPFVFNNVIGIPINIIAKSVVYHFAIVHHTFQRNHTHGNKSVPL